MDQFGIVHSVIIITKLLKITAHLILIMHLLQELQQDLRFYGIMHSPSIAMDLSDCILVIQLDD